MKKYDLDIKKDFDWVLQILKSCKNDIHLNIAENCFMLWYKKWSFLLKDRVYEYMIGSLKSKYKAHKSTEILKHGWNTNISK